MKISNLPAILFAEATGQTITETRLERGYEYCARKERERQRERHREIRYARDAMETIASRIFLFDTLWILHGD
jgi:hypothetical protein